MITIKTKQEINTMSEGGKILAQIMKELTVMVKPGITTNDLNRAAEALILKLGAKPSFKGYENFPAALCTSINEELVHMPPSDRTLKKGDIISLDLGILYKGFHTDMAITLAVGGVTPDKTRLIKVAKKALKRGLKNIKPGNTIEDIGNAIQRYVEGQGLNVIRDLCGHGIGKEIHEDPKIPNYGKRHKGETLKPGMVLCIEPMVAVGDYKLKKSQDGFGYIMADGSLSAHFEHTVAITKNGCEILTEF